MECKCILLKFIQFTLGVYLNYLTSQIYINGRNWFLHRNIILIRFKYRLSLSARDLKTKEICRQNYFKWNAGVIIGIPLLSVVSFNTCLLYSYFDFPPPEHLKELITITIYRFIIWYGKICDVLVYKRFLYTLFVNKCIVWKAVCKRYTL